MKINKLIYGVPLAILLIAGGSSCRKGQFNINKNVNDPTDSTVTYDVVLPAALHASGFIVGTQWGPIQNWMSFWARSGTYAPNVIEETYQITTGFGNGVWNNCYDNNYDYQIVVAKAAKEGAGFYEGIARIMKAHNFQILVDVYGNIPYNQALKGSGNPTPAYDNGVDVYKALLREIDAGILLIRRAVADNNKNIETNDILFHGNKTLWVKFANTLKLRMLIHAYAVAAIDKTVEVNTINNTLDTANGNAVYGYLSAGQDALVQPGYKSDKPMPFYNAFINTTTGAATANNVYYKANDWGIPYYAFDGDPRQARFYAAGSGGLIGVPYGLPPTTANAAAVLAGIGPGVARRYDSSQILMSASESFYLQAEAKQRGWNVSASTPQVLLQTAISENMRILGVANPATAAANYVAGNATYPDVDINGVPQGAGGPAGGLFTILQQKWFGLNTINTLEVWTDWRRVPYSEVATKIIYNNSNAPTDHFVYGDGGGYPGGPNSPGPGPFRSVCPQITPSDNIPVRYLYPQTEYNYNTANVAAQGTITRYSRIFWDLN